VLTSLTLHFQKFTELFSAYGSVTFRPLCQIFLNISVADRIFWLTSGLAEFMHSEFSYLKYLWRICDGQKSASNLASRTSWGF